MSEKHNNIKFLKDEFDITISDISKALNIKINSVYQRLNRKAGIENEELLYICLYKYGKLMSFASYLKYNINLGIKTKDSVSILKYILDFGGKHNDNTRKK